MSDSTRTVTPYEVARVFFRHQRKVLLVLSLGMVSTLAVLVLWPKSYSSEAKLFLKVGRASITLDPTATTGPTHSINTSRETEINSVVEMLQSRAMVEKVVDILGPDQVLARRKKAGMDPLGYAMRVKSHLIGMMTSSTSKRDRRAEAINQLQEKITIWSPRTSTVICVACREWSPERAQKVVATLVDVYTKEHIRLNRTAGSEEFFSQQVQLLDSQLAETTQLLRDAKNKSNLLTITGKQGTLEGQIGELEKRILVNRSTLAASRAKIGELTRQVKVLDSQIVTELVTGVANQARDGMRQQLYNLQMREAKLSSMYTEHYPAVVAIREQLKNVEAIIAMENKDRRQTKSGPNQTHQASEVNLVAEKAHLSSLEAEYLSLAEQQSNIQVELRSLNNQETHIRRLERKAKLIETSYLAHAEKLEQARIDAALQQERITNVNVVQAATFLPEPVGPKSSLVAALGLLMVVLGSAGTALVAEYLDHTVKSTAEAEAALGIPVLISIPQIFRQRLNA